MDSIYDICRRNRPAETPVYLRSSAKPFIAAAIVAAGAAERFGLNAREIAVMSASHAGEPEHVEAVRSMLGKIGADTSELRCGASPGANVLQNNCSGKHAGILGLCRILNVDSEEYLEPAHPAQTHILAFCARMTGESVADLPLGVDGCGIPVFATSLRRAARAFARLASLKEVSDADAAALRVVRDAIAAEPFYLGGSAHFDTALIQATQGRVVGKGGAEGVHGDALIERGLGLALKVIDGSDRARPPAMLRLLRDLGALDAEAETRLARFAEPDVRNVAGRVVGKMRVAP